jgi:hypothetical protein
MHCIWILRQSTLRSLSFEESRSQVTCICCCQCHQDWKEDDAHYMHCSVLSSVEAFKSIRKGGHHNKIYKPRADVVELLSHCTVSEANNGLIEAISSGKGDNYHVMPLNTRFERQMLGPISSYSALVWKGCRTKQQETVVVSTLQV